jgi:GTPase-associated protein 1, N-terminal domain type 2/GTPase-associated protein 1, middle domain
MTVGAFDRLLYTDCRAGTGRGAGGGFQVQAQSSSVDSAQAKMAVGWLLYDPPNAWIVQRRPVEEFPLGLAHVAEAGYGTAQSRYMGTEATGARQGNHLADCLLTRDRELYGPIRPAQLWRSPLWRAEPWETTDCPQFDDALVPGPLTVDAVAEWLRASAERAPVLARLLSVLEDPAGRRVVITAAEPGEALAWVAAATLLLPIRAALDVSFKVFCVTPQRGSHRIVAVPKELNPQVGPGRGDSAFILDAEEAISGAAEVSARASFWVGLLANADDPYDVVDAVELADLLGAGLSRDGMDAIITAWAVTAPGDPLDDASVLFRWLSGADAKLQQEHGPSVVHRILAAGPTAPMLRWIDDAATLGHVDSDRLAVRIALLTAEIAEIRSGSRPPASRLAPVDLDPSTRRDADSELSSAIVLAPHQQVDLLLLLAERHGVEPQLPPLLDRLRGFAIDWIDHPARDYQPEGWALRDEVLDLAHGELEARLAQYGTAGVLDTLKRLWRYFADRSADLIDLLDLHVQAAGMRTLSAEQRRARLAALLAQAGNGPRAEATLDGLQQVLLDWGTLGPGEALLLLPALPDAVPVAQAVVDTAVGEIGRVAVHPTTGALDALEALQRRGLIPRGKPFADLLAADANVRKFVEATRSPKFGDDRPWTRQWIKDLAGIMPAVLRARRRLLLETSLEYPAPWLGAYLLRTLPAPLPQALIDSWGRELGGQWALRAAVWGAHWAGDPALEEFRPGMVAMFREFGSRLSPADRERWLLDVQNGLGPDQASNWAEITGQDSPKRRGFRFHGKEP